jgi:hypothetical protein
MKQQSERDFFMSKVLSMRALTLQHITLAYPSNTLQNDRNNLMTPEAALGPDAWNKFFTDLIKLQPNQPCDLYLDCKFLDLHKLGLISQAVQALDIKFKNLAIHNIQFLTHLLNINDTGYANSMTSVPVGDLWKSNIEVEDLGKSVLSYKLDIQSHEQKVSKLRVQMQEQMQKDLSSFLDLIFSVAEKINFTKLPPDSELVFGALMVAKCNDLAISIAFDSPFVNKYLHTLISSNHHIKNLDISAVQNIWSNEKYEVVIGGCIDNPRMGIKYAPAVVGNDSLAKSYKEFADVRTKKQYTKVLSKLIYMMKEGLGVFGEVHAAVFALPSKETIPEETIPVDGKGFLSKPVVWSVGIPMDVIKIIFGIFSGPLQGMVSDGMTIPAIEFEDLSTLGDNHDTISS